MHLKSQHLGGRDRWILESEVSMNYTHSRDSQDQTEKPHKVKKSSLLESGGTCCGPSMPENAAGASHPASHEETLPQARK